MLFPRQVKVLPVRRGQDKRLRRVGKSLLAFCCFLSEVQCDRYFLLLPRFLLFALLSASVNSLLAPVVAIGCFSWLLRGSLHLLTITFSLRSRLRVSTKCSPRTPTGRPRAEFHSATEPHPQTSHNFLFFR